MSQAQTEVNPFYFQDLLLFTLNILSSIYVSLFQNQTSVVFHSFTFHVILSKIEDQLGTFSPFPSAFQEAIITL